MQRRPLATGVSKGPKNGMMLQRIESTSYVLSIRNTADELLSGGAVALPNAIGTVVTAAAQLWCTIISEPRPLLCRYEQDDVGRNFESSIGALPTGSFEHSADASANIDVDSSASDDSPVSYAA
ncbi:hypothetical protein THAOC_33896, partial [Thalassiosira oceanica]